MGCVYRATCNTNGKYYIGKTLGALQDRMYAHKICKDKCLFHKAIRKYGWDDFEWDILYESEDEESLYQKEKLFIKLYNSYMPCGYNMTTGGDGNYSREFSKDWHFNNMERAYRLAKQVYCVELNTRYRSIAEAHYDTGISTNCIVNLCNDTYRKSIKYHFCFNNPEAILELQNRYIQDLLEYGYYVNMSAESCTKRSEAGLKRKWSEMTREKMKGKNSGSNNFWYGKKMPQHVINSGVAYRKEHYVGDGNPSAKAVINIDTGEHFTTMKGAVEFYNLPPRADSNICSCCNNRLKTAYGYRWAYYNEGEDLQRS